MADGGASSSSQQKKPSKMALVEYFSFIKRNKKLKTVTDRDNQMESLEEMAEDVRSGDPDKQLEATSLFRNILQIYPNPPFQQVIQAGVLPHFVQFLDLHFFPSLQVEAVFILGMFVKSSEHMNILVYHSAIPGLVNLIDSAHKITRKAVMFTLARIARNSPQLLERVLYYKGLKRLLVQFEENDLEFMLPVAAQALYLICSRGNPPLNPKMSSRFFPALQQLLQSSNEEVVADACWIFHYLSYARIGDVNAPIMLGVCSKLVEILDRTSPTIILPALMTVANIVGSDEVLDQNEYLRGLVIQSMILPERLERLEKLLVGEYDNNIKKAACQTVRNITNKNWHRTQEVIKHGLITAVTNLYKNSEDDIKMEVARAILSVTCYGTPEDIKSVSGACIEPLCGMLDCYDDADLALDCLRGIHKILVLWQAELIKGTSQDANQCIEKITEVKGPQKILKLLNEAKGSVSDIAWSILYIHWRHLLP